MCTAKTSNGFKHKHSSIFFKKFCICFALILYLYIFVRFYTVFKISIFNKDDIIVFNQVCHLFLNTPCIYALAAVTFICELRCLKVTVSHTLRLYLSRCYLYLWACVLKSYCIVHLPFMFQQLLPIYVSLIA